jgi:SAM-dependent methyltransferase
MSDDDPETGRRFLTQKAYADDSKIRARMAIYQYAEGAASARGRTSAVAWDGTQVVADVGCGSGFDLRPLVTGGRCRLAIGVDLSAGMLHGMDDLRGSGRLALVQGDAQRLPLADQVADVGLAMHMLYHVPDIPAALSELRRIVKPGGTVLASTNSARHLAEMDGLLDAAVRAQLGRKEGTLSPPPRFSTENGQALLEEHFPSVTLHQREVPLLIPAPAPVVAYLDSLREPVMASLRDRVDYDAALDSVAAAVESEVREHGHFRTASRAGVFVCR